MLLRRKNLLIYHVKVILILLLKNIPHEKLEILVLLPMMKYWSTIDVQVEFVEAVSNLNDSVMDKNQGDQTAFLRKKDSWKKKMDLLLFLIFAICYHAYWWRALQSNQLINPLRIFFICLKNVHAKQNTLEQR